MNEGLRVDAGSIDGGGAGAAINLLATGKARHQSQLHACFLNKAERSLQPPFSGGRQS